MYVVDAILIGLVVLTVLCFGMSWFLAFRTLTFRSDLLRTVVFIVVGALAVFIGAVLVVVLFWPPYIWDAF